MATRDSILELIGQYDKGLSYRSIQAHSKLERAALDPVLQCLVSERKIRYTLTGYVAIDEAKQAAVYGSAQPMRQIAPKTLNRGHAKTCRYCKEMKPADAFYTGLSECKACTRKRSAANRRARRIGQMEKLVDALIHIAQCPQCCERHRQIAEIAIEGNSDA
jgi:hypothetical protein